MALAMVALFVLFIYLADERWLIPCLFHKLTALDCPFCGGQRMLCALLHGEWREAFGYNPLLLCTLPWFIVAVVRMCFPYFSHRHPRLTLARLFTDKALLYMALLFFLWGILRNIENFV